MTFDHLGIIGTGAIADIVLTTLSRELARPLAKVTMLSSERSVTTARALLDRLGEGLARERTVATGVGDLLSDPPDVVAECAGHGAVREHGVAVLNAGCDLVVISIGALSDAALMTALRAAAQRGRSQIVLPAGAVGGVDALAAARLSGLESVIYTGRKPPKAWKGTPAETLVALDALTAPAIFFKGSAREAAKAYPLNANVAATLALAGLGLDETQVQLVADPSVTRNVHEFSVQAGCGDFTVHLQGRPSPANPKTSLMAGYSVARELLNRVGPVAI